MIEGIARHRCTGDDGSSLCVVEHRHAFTTQGEGSMRHYRGAAWATLLDGEPVRHIDARTFEVVATGELLTHDLEVCDCAPAAIIATRSGASMKQSGRT